MERDKTGAMRSLWEDEETGGQLGCCQQGLERRVRYSYHMQGSGVNSCGALMERQVPHRGAGQLPLRSVNLRDPLLV